MPGKTMESISRAYFSLHRISPARGPRNVLCGVAATQSANGHGPARSPHATSPRPGAGMCTRGHQPRHVRDVRQQPCSDLLRNLAHALEVDDARVSAGADGDHPWPVLAGHLRELIVIDSLVFLPYPVVNDFEEFP